MLATFALSLLALASTPAFASNAAHHLDGRGCGHKKAADRFIKRSLPFGARSEIPVIAINSNIVGANSSTNANLIEVFNSTALWFEATGGASACGLVYNNSELVVSLPTTLWTDPLVVSSACGQEVLVHDLETGKNVSATVSGISNNNYTLLSKAAFSTLASLDVGMVDVQFWFTNSTFNVTSAFPNATLSSSAVARVASVSQVQLATPSAATPLAQATTYATTTQYYDSQSAVRASASATAAQAQASADAEASAQAASAAGAAAKSSADAAWASSSSSAAAAAAAPTKATTPASSSSSSQTYTGGFATYFLQNGVAGNCGTVAQESDKVIALPTVTYANGAHCGQQIRITRTDTGASVTATVRDSCPTCVNNESLDLSEGAFFAIASAAEGMVPISWVFV